MPDALPPPPSDRSAQARAQAVPPPTLAEEIASTLTHGAGLVLSVIGLVALFGLAARVGEAVHLPSVVVFGATLVLMYAASTSYHVVRSQVVKRVLQTVDHVAIFLLIAGTYTPFTIAFFDDPLRTNLLVAVWTLAIVGTVFKVFFTGRFPRVSTAIYVAMGWAVVIVAEPFLAAVPTDVLLWLIAGGLFYTAGVAFFLWERLPYNHAIWHLFVIGGSACHYVAVVLSFAG